MSVFTVEVKDGPLADALERVFSAGVEPLEAARVLCMAFLEPEDLAALDARMEAGQVRVLAGRREVEAAPEVVEEPHPAHLSAERVPTLALLGRGTTTELLYALDHAPRHTVAVTRYGRRWVSDGAGRWLPVSRSAAHVVHSGHLADLGPRLHAPAP